MVRRSRRVPFLLGGLVLSLLDIPGPRVSCGQQVYDKTGPEMEFSREPENCWIFSHMPKSGGYTIQTMLQHYAKNHDVLLGRYDSDEWLAGTRQAELFLHSGYTLIGGGYTDGLRPHGGQDCKWFTMFRHPIPRLVSAYFWCKNRPNDQLCATVVLDARTTDLGTFASHWSNFGLRQFAQAFVTQPDVLLDELATGVCPTDDGENVCPGWFRIKQYFEKGGTEGHLPGWPAGAEPLPDVAMYRLLRPVEELLTSNYTAVGILERWDTSMRLFNKALELPRWKWDRVFANIGKLNSNSHYRFEAKSVLHQAWSDPDIRRVIWLDILLYDHALAIFNRQVEEYGVL